MSRSNKRYGNSIGSHLGKPIYDVMEDTETNQQFTFVRIAKGDAEGYPLDQLKSNEVLFNPGLIYKKQAKS